MFNAINAGSGIGDARRAHLLVYDIPNGCKVANPSQMLWRFGVRINLSCWLVPDTRVPLIPVKEWEKAGVKVELVRFDERDGDTILRLAREGLIAEVGRVREALDNATAAIEKKCSGIRVISDEARESARKAGNLSYFHLQRAKKFNAAARECALGFDLLGEVERVFDGLREAIKANEEVMYAAVSAAKRRTEPGPIEVPSKAASLDELVGDASTYNEEDGNERSTS